MQFNDLDTALNWLMSIRKRQPRFDKFARLMDDLGHPEGNFKMVHVAGTNGKGSTITFLRDSLVALGYKVGTLQSPHYKTHLDRIRINGRPIPGNVFLDILNEHVDMFIKEGLSMFEMDYLIMCEWFLKESVDFALVEVGIGGRLDSTNVVKHPLLSIIVTIGYDHMEVLGNTKEAITYEKAGIIKDDSAILVGNLDANLRNIVKDEADKHRSKYLHIKDIEDLGLRRFGYRDEVYELTSYAHYQKHNAAVAIEALYYLNDIGVICLDIAKVKLAIKKSLWQGRYEIISEHPLVILDGAHNIDAVKALIESIKDITKSKGVLFSAIKSKEHRSMLEMLKGAVDEIVLTSFDSPKTLMDLENVAKALDLSYIPDMKEAYQHLAGRYECIIVCGSLYLLSAFNANVEVKDE